MPKPAFGAFVWDQVLAKFNVCIVRGSLSLLPAGILRKRLTGASETFFALCGHFCGSSKKLESVKPVIVDETRDAPEDA